MHRGVPVVVRNVERIAIAPRRHRHLGDVTIGNGQERLAHLALGLEVETSMKMVRTQLTKVSA